jgi:hypothetical protein
VDRHSGDLFYGGGFSGLRGGLFCRVLEEDRSRFEGSAEVICAFAAEERGRALGFLRK